MTNMLSEINRVSSLLQGRNKLFFNYKGVFFTSLVIILFLSGCSKNNIGVADCRFDNSVEIPLSGLRYAGNSKLFTNGSDSFIVILDQTKLKIYFYDLIKNKIWDSINIKVFNHYVYIQNFEVLSFDSIILAFNPTYLANFHDQSVVLINRNAEIIGQFNFKGAPVLMINDNKNIKDDFYYFSNFNTFPLIFKDDFLIAPLTLNQHDVFGERVRQSKPYTLGKVSLNPNTNYKGIYSIDTTYSDVFFYPISRRIRGCLGYNNQVVFSYGYNNQLFYFDYEKEIVHSKWIDFVSIDTILPLETNPEDYIDFSVPDYQEIYYDSKNRRYYRIARLPLNRNTTNEMYDFPQHVFIVFDENLNKIAEGLLPFGCEKPLIPLNDGFLIWDKQSSFLSNKIVFKMLEIKIVESNLKSFHKSIENQFNDNKTGINLSIKQYLGLISSTLPKFKQYILIDIDISCPCVSTKIGEFLMHNKYVFERNDIALVLISQNKENIDKFLKEYELVSFENKQVFSDVSSLYKKTFLPWGNIKFIKKKRGKFIEEHYVSGTLNLLFDILKD